MPATALLISGGICVSLLIGSALSGARQPLRCMLFHLLLGIASLLFVNLIGIFTGISLPLSLFHILVSAGGGPAGTALLLFLRYGIF